MSDQKFAEEEFTETAPYTKSALVYDRMMLHVNYLRWAAYIDAVLQKAKLDRTSGMLDIGCGTGRFLQEMHKLGYRGDGCDPSAHMLAIARKRLPQATFYHCGMPELTGIPADRYPVITSLYDTINYLLDEATLAAALQRIYALLPATGMFIFDAVSRANCRHYFQHYTDSEVLDDNTAYYRESYFDEKTKMQYNWLRIYTTRGIFEEMHRQYIFSFGQIKKIIQNRTDFELTHCFSEFTFRRATASCNRAHFVLRKRGTRTS